MLRRFLFLSAVTATSALLLAGCKTIATAEHEAKEESALQQRAAAHAHYAAGVIHDLHGESVLALQEYYEAVLADTDDEMLVLEVSRRFLLNNQPDKAREILTRAVKRPTASGEIYTRLGFVYSQLGQTNLALSAAHTAIRKAPQILDGYQILYLTYLRNGQPDKALAVLDDAASATDTDAEFLIGLGQLYLNFGAQAPLRRTTVGAKAREVFLRALKTQPTDIELRLKLAEGFSTVNDPDHVAQIYSELLPELSNDPRMRGTIRARLADIYLKKEDRQHAFEQLESIVQDDPANPQIYYYLGTLAFDQQEMQKASDYFSKAIMLKPDFEPAYFDFASAELNLNRATNALQTMEQARKKFPQSFMIEFLSAVAHNQQQEYPEALTNFWTAENLAAAGEPQRLTGGFYFQVGAACERAGNIIEAEKYFLKCLDLQPTNDEAMNYLGYMWADHGIKLDRARELIEKALKIEPKNEAYLDSMGWVLFKLGQPQEALDYILQAIAASEEPDADLQDHLGDVYSALHQTDKALEAWKKSIAAKPNDAVSKKIDATGKK